MDNPPKQTRRANPRKPGQNKPNYTDNYSTVIYLTDPRDQQT